MFYFYPQVVCFNERLTSYEIKLKLKDGGTCNIVNNANIKQSFFNSCSQDIYTITTGLLKKICKDGCIELCTKKNHCSGNRRKSIQNTRFSTKCVVPIKNKQILLHQQFMAYSNMPLQTCSLEFS